MSYRILCAASDTPMPLKQKADFICEENDARPVLQAAIDEADRLGVGGLRVRSSELHRTRGQRGGGENCRQAEKHGAEEMR